MNYNDPLEVTEIHRIVTLQPNDADGNVVAPDVKEYGYRISLTWEQVKRIREYCYQDDWTTYKGPKFYLYVDYTADGNLIYGDYHSFYEHWKNFRNAYPLFVDHSNNNPLEKY